MEDYKKKYEAAIKQAKKELKACGSLDCDAARQIFRLFPELKENEDEKIRKEIIQSIQDNMCVIHKDKCIAWLEKQGEHANFRNKIQIGDKVTRNEDGVLVNLSQLNRVAKHAEKQREQKTIEIPFGTDSELVEETVTIPNGCYAVIEGNKVILRKGVLKQKSTWSEEDKGNLLDVKCIIDKVWHNQDVREEIDYSGEELESLWHWLDNIWQKVAYPESPSKQTAWSEEDEKILNEFIESLKYCHGNGYNKQISWLKSLKERYTWKPSNEQIEALLKLEEMHVIEHEKNQENAHLYMVVKSIREQLLKLKGE